MEDRYAMSKTAGDILVFVAIVTDELHIRNRIEVITVSKGIAVLLSSGM
jgi:hypothetical protein